MVLHRDRPTGLRPRLRGPPAYDEEWPTEARSGGTVKSQEAFDLDPTITIGGLLTVEGYDEGFDTVYAEFLLTCHCLLLNSGSVQAADQRV